MSHEEEHDVRRDSPGRILEDSIDSAHAAALEAGDTVVTFLRGRGATKLSTQQKRDWAILSGQLLRLLGKLNIKPRVEAD